MLGRDGFHLKFGSLTTGSGFAFGGGYRNRRLFDREGALNVWAAARSRSTGRSRAASTCRSRRRPAVARHLRAPPELPAGGLLRHRPRLDRDDHYELSISEHHGRGRVGVKPAPIADGRRRRRVFPAPNWIRAEQESSLNRRLFDDTSRHRDLFDTRNFLRPYRVLEFDYRQPKNARRGGWYRIEASHFDEPTDAFTFNRFDADLRQFASILAERRVLAVRLFVSTSDPASGARVPFYLMPHLGGHDSLRGFRDYRFRGPHAILTQTEYRFEIWSGLDAALFYDAGKVALRRSDLNFKNLEHAYGFGFRFNTDNGTILRIDAGFGSSDGKHLYIVFGDVF